MTQQEMEARIEKLKAERYALKETLASPLIEEMPYVQSGVFASLVVVNKEIQELELERLRQHNEREFIQ